MIKYSLILLGIFVIQSAIFCSKSVAQKTNYRIEKEIKLSGDGGWDYLSVDQINHHLFVSHSSQVNVVDLKTGEEIGVIPQTNGVHGIAIANDLNRLFISCGKDSSVMVVDAVTLKILSRIIGTGSNPDAILYDRYSQTVYTFNGKSSNATVIDAKTLKIIATIPLSGKPEFAQTDNKGAIFVNIEDNNTLNRINSKDHLVEKSWSIAPGEEPSGLALDLKNQRLFSVCRNKMMVVSDSQTGKVITSVPIGNGCDGVTFDSETRRIIASNGEGTITVIQQVSADKYNILETLPTQQGARTITIDPSTHHLYLSVGEYIPGTDRRKAVKPGTFKVIVVEPN
jgi:YVTN family beta-propeller protein